jgi:N-acetylglucosamine-6-phosphate deacetylase
VLEEGTVVLRDGIITDVLPGRQLPADARVVDLSGKSLYPGLIDAFSERSVSSASGGAGHWNDQVTPQRSVADTFQADTASNEKLRKQGVSAQLVAPSGGIVKGTSALVLTDDASGSTAIVRADVTQHVRLTVSRGRRRDQYPNSPMGAVALARQAMYDAQWYRRAWSAYRVDTTLPRPERNDALEVLQQYLDGRQSLVIDASNELFFLRADRFAREFGLPLIVRGSGREYRRLDAIKETGRTILLPVNFAKPPNVGTAEAALDVELEDLLHWELAPKNPARLAAAGIHFALTSHGLADRSKFLDHVRTAVRRGLSEEDALRALTTTPARLFGADAVMGSIAVGKLGNLVVTDGALFDEDTKIEETWVGGRRYQHELPATVDLRGKWQVTLMGDGRPTDRFRIELTGAVNRPKGKIVRIPGSSEKEEDGISLDNTGLRNARFSCTFSAASFGLDGVARLTAVISTQSDREEPRAAAAWIGQIVWPDDRRSPIRGRLIEKNEDDDGTQDEDMGGDANGATEQDEEPADAEDNIGVAINYPLGAFGRSAIPEQPAAVLFRNATIWSCGPQGTLENASLVVAHGKVVAVGTNIEPPPGAIVVDAQGKHITPGIIDCHSHMATDGGVNESAQAITAEVRIGDFVDANDIDIYRQLAGGVTSSNILHGSANPIGGQNQVIKLRWGSLPEEMKFQEAPAGIKFALGENVKQSNWGDEHTTRYPQTRMGVEQLMRDAFLAARQYRSDWTRWEQEHRGLPPRRDLELEAIAEIQAGERWIHCHSYRQDEILALIRTLDEFGITIGTFQHILEGYKVADAMARHGAMGSAFSDWWAYKFEVYDAIPFAGALMHDVGVVVSFNSDDQELGRHLNHEAAKAMKYGGVPAEEALKFVTLNPARQLRIDEYVGSLEEGKHADLVVWSGDPLSILSRCEQTWVDGRKYFDVQDDRASRDRARQLKNRLVQKVLASSKEMKSKGEDEKEESELWPRYDEFCRCQRN